ncbi:MAG: phosphate ABC transporter substrate-binding protein PstS [Terriglobia bacterium]
MKAMRICILCCSLALSGWALSSCSHAPSAGRQNGSPILINVAGSTFGYPIYSKWFDVYHQLHPRVELNYASIGSGGGIEQTRVGTVDFGASDMPLDNQLLSTFKFKVVQLTTVMGATVPMYHLPGITAELKFTPQALAGIYLGKITKWNDQALARANPGVNLPGDKIITLHRSDGSGTTFVWTDYLSKVSSEWKAKVGSNTAVDWPVGLGGKGSEGVAGLIEQTPYSIGYVELVYALENHILYGAVENSSGKYIKATLTSVTAAAADAAPAMEKDIRVSITNPPGSDAYPISCFTYFLIPATFSNPTKGRIIKHFLRWMLTDGQKYAAPLGYAPLPKAVVNINLKRLSQIQ